MKFYVWEKEIEFDEVNHQLKFDDKVLSPNIRTYGDMKEMYLEKVKKDDSEWLYFMFRWVYLNSADEDKFKKNGLRYDITVILPELIWEEFNKTYGHYHPVNDEWNRYEEIYEVLSWSAIFLQQKSDVVKYTDSFEWDKVVMDEWFGHVTINPSDEDILVMANIVYDDFESEYKEYSENLGANFYYLTKWFVENPKYDNHLETMECESFFEWADMYEQFLDDPDKFNFLH